MVTTCDWSGPSTVLNDHVQVPLAFCEIVPTDAVTETVSWPGSEKRPSFVAVCPSFTVRAAWVTATVGATLLTTRLNAVVDTAPSLSVAVMVTAWDWTGPSLAEKDQVQEPSAFSTTVPTEAA